MTEPREKPLLTFAVVAYNQERFVQEAVEAAFAQTYSPLEIILSDDCSGDRTFEIMRELAAAYRGPHRVVLNRNPARRSIGGHINRVMELSRGELIVGAAGDDVSLPRRTQVTYEAWEQSGRLPTSIYSNVIQVDEHGRQIEQLYTGPSCPEDTRVILQPVEPWAYAETFRPTVFGCAHAWSRQLFTVFGSMPDEVIHEDNVLPFRSAILAGRFVYVQERLVKYRLHGNNIFLRDRKRSTGLKRLEQQEEHLRHGCDIRKITYGSFLADVQKARARELIGTAEFERTVAATTRMHRRYSLMRDFMGSGLFRRFKLFGQLRETGMDAGEFRIVSRRLLPRPLFLRLRLLRSWLALARNRAA